MIRAGRVAVVIPMRDESASIPGLFPRFLSATAEGLDLARIVVVDGDSSDGTVQRVLEYADRLPLDVVELGRDCGLGGALQVGLARALEHADAIVTMDGDGSHDPHAIPALLGGIESGADVVIASRFAPGGREVGVPAHRRALSHVAGRLFATLFPFGPVRDYSSGFRAYRAEALRVVARHGELVRERGFACMLELLLRLRASGCHATEVPLVLRYDLKPTASKMNLPRTIARYFVVLARHWRTVGPFPPPAGAAADRAVAGP